MTSKGNKTSKEYQINNKNTGDSTNRFNLFKDNYPSIILNSSFSSTYLSWVAIKFDLIFVREILCKLLHLQSQEVKTPLSLERRCLYISATVIYMKCFTKSKTRNTRLDKTNIKNKKLQSIHERIASDRHNLYAHQGESKFEIMRAEMAIVDSENDKYELRCFQLQRIGPFEHLDDFCKLVDQLIKHVENKISKAAKKVYENEHLDLSKAGYWRLG